MEDRSWPDSECRFPFSNSTYDARAERPGHCPWIAHGELHRVRQFIIVHAAHAVGVAYRKAASFSRLRICVLSVRWPRPPHTAASWRQDRSNQLCDALQPPRLGDPVGPAAFVIGAFATR